MDSGFFALWTSIESLVGSVIRGGVLEGGLALGNRKRNFEVLCNSTLPEEKTCPLHPSNIFLKLPLMIIATYSQERRYTIENWD